jgi:hypothetical protein
MGQRDIFSYTGDVKEKQIVAARNAALDLGNGRVALVQSLEGNYGHQVQPVYEAGSSSIYFVNGNPQGTFSYSTLVGTQGWFAGFPMSGACASLRTINIDLISDNPECDVQVTMHNNVKFEGAILTQVSFSIQAGGLQISNTGQFTCAKMIRV